MKLGEIAKKLGCELRGSKEVEINGVAGIEEAEEEEVQEQEQKLLFLGRSNPASVY